MGGKSKRFLENMPLFQEEQKDESSNYQNRPKDDDGNSSEQAIGTKRTASVKAIAALPLRKTIFRKLFF